MPTPSFLQLTQKTVATPLQAIGALQPNVALTSVIELTSPNGLPAQLIIQASAAARMLFVFDATNPTSSVGFEMVANTLYSFYLSGDQAMRFIEETSGATITYQWTEG